jgi:hypothetical protein
MLQIRGELNEDVSGVMASVKRLLNWRSYLQRFPKSSLALAAAVGYLIVPRKTEILTPDADALEELSKRHKLVVEKQPKSAGSTGAGSPLMRLVISTLLRAGIMKATESFGVRKTPRTPEPKEEAVDA